MTLPVPPAKLASQDPPIRSWPGHTHARTSHPDTRLQEGQYDSSVPTVADRVAPTVVARHLGARVEKVFHEDSYRYRAGRSALDAAQVCRERCWKRDWVIDLDIQKFFDSVRWDLIGKAVQAHTDAPWVVL